MTQVVNVHNKLIIYSIYIIECFNNGINNVHNNSFKKLDLMKVFFFPNNVKQIVYQRHFDGFFSPQI
jgi:hypothetical protein